MLSNSVINFRLLLVFILISLFLSACDTETTLPLPNGIPKSDIVFMPGYNPVSATYQDGQTLGFTNADGTNKVVFTFKILQGARSNFGADLWMQTVDHPRWSITGDMLAFSVRGIPPDIRLIDSQGRMYGQKCDDLDKDSTFDLQGNILGEITKDSPLYQEYQNRMTVNTSLVARYDLKACKVVDVFSVPLPSKSDLREFSEGQNGLITAAYYVFSSDKRMVMIFKPAASTLISFSGHHPSLNQQGTLLAYFDPAGNLNIRDTESGKEKTIIRVASDYGDFYDYMYMPGWSPDDRWLVYNTPDGKIYKVNRETGENVYITDGWAPDWRP